MALFPVDADKLWVILKSGERLFLSGNPHRSSPALSGWDEERGGATFGLQEIVDASPEARIWLDGYIAGIEPELGEFLGITGDELQSAWDDESTVDRWMAALRKFRETGFLPPLNLRPTIPFSANEEFEVTPWATAGDQVWK